MVFHFRSFFLFILIVFSSSLLFADAGRALKLYEKKDFEKLPEYLQKNLEKDSLAPGIKYVYSLLLLDTGFAGYHIDSAYIFIVDAHYSYSLIDEKERSKLAKDGISDSTILRQKSRVEATAFRRARDEHSIADYDYYIDFFSTAREVDSAIVYRDQIAYFNAVEENTYQAFEYFFTSYPNAVQVKEAMRNYERLLFQSKTGGGRLTDYIRFLEENPDTPYRSEAELEILLLATADNSEKSYAWFMENYPRSRYKKRAADFLFHVLLFNHTPTEIIDRYPFYAVHDSLKNILNLYDETIFPIFEEGRYSFINSDGNTVPGISADSIPPDLICGNLTNDIIEGYSDDSLLLISLDAGIIHRGPKANVEFLKGGFILLETDREKTLVHKTGTVIRSGDFDEVELLDNTFFKYRKGEKWGLFSVMGKQILSAEFDEIETESGFFVLVNGEHLAITNKEELKKAAEGIDIPLFYSYDDYFSIDDSHLIVISDKKEALLKPDLSIAIKLENHKINRFFGGWMVESQDGYRLYDEEFEPLSGETYSRILKDPHKMAFRLKGLWGIAFEGQKFNQGLYFDSVYFLHENITLLFNQQNTYVRYKGDSLHKLDDYLKLSLLKPQSISGTGEKLPGYLLIETKRGFLKVMDESGVEVISGKFDEIEALGKEYLVVTRNNKKGLYLHTGKELLKTSYQGISNYNDGYVSTMLNNKFGIFHYQDELLLSAKHTKTLKPFGQHYFVSESSDRFAFVNRENEFITEYQFKKIEYWNDTSALVKTDDNWQIFDIKNNKVAYDGITLYENLESPGGERLILITKENQNGVLSNLEGEIIGPTFNAIYNVGRISEPVFFAEKYVKEADFYIVIYYKKSGDIIRKQVFTDEEYWNIYCQE